MGKKIVEHTHHMRDLHDIDTIIAKAEPIDVFPDICFPLDIGINKNLLLESWFQLFNRLGYSYDTMAEMLRQDFVDKYKTLGNPKNPVAWDMNLTYEPGLTGNDRWRKFRGTIEWIKEDGSHPRRASEILAEMDGLYLKSVLEKVFAHHKQTFDREFFGQANVTWVGVNERYNLHNDHNIYLRYHIPIITHPSVFWLFQDLTNEEKFYRMHMPMGQVWMFEPVDVVHTVVNNWDTPRAHIIISEFKEGS